MLTLGVCAFVVLGVRALVTLGVWTFVLGVWAVLTPEVNCVTLGV